jgi:hypothetical protein
MVVDIRCGICESEFTMECENDDVVIPLVHRFFGAHAECGFATSIDNTDELASSEPTIKVIRPRRLKPTYDVEPVEFDEDGQ